MSEQRQEIARLCFKGARYDGSALDAVALEELVQFQKIVTEMAKAVWKQRHPDRERLPKDFEESTQFVFRTIEDGSTVVPLEMPRNSNQLALWDDPNEINEAIDLAYGAFTAANQDTPLPEGIPKEVLPSLAAFGKRLPSDAEIRFAPPGRDMTPVSPEACQRLNAMAGVSYVDELEVTGRVLEADVRQSRFQIWMDDGTNARVRFTEEQESEVTTALKEHASVQLLVKGLAEFGSNGVLQQIQSAEYLKVIPDDDPGLDTSAPRIEDVISDIFGSVTDPEWDQVPSDLSHRHDFYLYGDGGR